MKNLFFTLFLGFGFSVFSANTAVGTIIVLDETNVERIVESDKEISNIDESQMAFECYYTVEWLYKACPFIKKIEALA